jgi:hypothetical protein
MREARRGFLMTLAAAVSCFVGPIGLLFAQSKRLKIDPPAPAETQNPAAADTTKQDPQIAKRAALQQSEKEFRAGVEQLYQMVGELRQEVDKTATMNVFSVQMYKKTEEIEKLAKKLKGKARG